jgi:hypothetical protein
MQIRKAITENNVPMEALKRSQLEAGQELDRLRSQFCKDYENFGRSMGVLEDQVKACGVDVHSQNSNIAKASVLDDLSGKISPCLSEN